MTAELVAGIDVGTSSVKVLIGTPEGKVLGRGSATYPVFHDRPLWSEQNADDWWDAMATATRAALDASGADPAAVASLCLSTQGGTLVPVGADGAPTRRAVVWSDTRCAKQRADVVAEAGEDLVYETCGWALGSALNLLQIRWLRDHEPETVRRTARYLSVPDFLAWKMTGRAALDPSNGGVNQLASVRTGQWSPELLALAGVTEAEVGELLPAGDVVGELTVAAAQHLGFAAGTLVVNGGHDQYLVALGSGVIAPGDVFIGSGTAWVTAVIRDEPRFDVASGISISRHVVPGLYGELASLESAGEALEWWRRLVARDGQPPTWDDLDAGLRGKDGLSPIFLPYMKGCPFPKVVHDAPGTLWGLDPGHGPYDLAAAIMAGVAFQTAWALRGIDSPHPVAFAGGAAKSGWWSQFMADVSPAPIRALTEPDAGALGAALLAATGAGLRRIDDPVTLAGAVLEPGPLAEARRDALDAYTQVAQAVLAAHQSMRK